MAPATGSLRREKAILILSPSEVSPLEPACRRQATPKGAQAKHWPQGRANVSLLLFPRLISPLERRSRGLALRRQVACVKPLRSAGHRPGSGVLRPGSPLLSHACQAAPCAAQTLRDSKGQVPYFGTQTLSEQSGDPVAATRRP